MTFQIIDPSAQTGIPINPFPGLRPFEFDESHLFFGRDGQSEQLITKLGHTRFMAVVGTSGSGKSSLIRAGLLPALHGGFMSSAGSAWRIAIMRPGNDPVGNLAKALNSPDVFGSEIEENASLQTALAEATLRRGSRGLVDTVRQAVMPEKENLLVVVDQFEEIFRFARVAEGDQYKNEAAAFVKLILEAARQREVRIYVVLTMRSDYLGDCSQFWDLPEAINEGQYLIPRLTRDQLREAITGPVAVGGGKMTPRLVNRLLNDVGENQDQLPVLQHLLMRVWDEWKEKRLEVLIDEGTRQVTKPHKEVHEGEPIDLCCYEGVGGMAEALSRHADDAFAELPDDRHRVVAEKLFKALTEKGPDNREIRRPITVREICAVIDATPAEVITVIETFRQPGRSFLMPPTDFVLHSDSLIDISHESLIRGWARLRDWVDEETRSARIYRRLAETAELHREGKAGLWGDPDLQLALDWHDKNEPNEHWARRYYPGFEIASAFLRASEQKRVSDLAEQEHRQQAEIERVKRELEQAKILAEEQQRRAEAEQQKAQEQHQRLEEKARATRRLRRLLILLVIASILALIAVIAAAEFIRLAQQKTQSAGAAIAQAEAAKREARQSYDAAEENKQLAKIKEAEAAQLAQVAKEQKQHADELQRTAEAAQAEAQTQHRVAAEQQMLADKKEGLNRELLYAANIKLAERAYDENDLSRMKELLDIYLPGNVAVGPDLRGFEWFRFQHAYQKPRVTIGKHSGGVTAVAFSPNGKTLVSVGDDTLKLWDTTRSAEPITQPVERSLFHAVAFAPDGTFATLSNGSVKLWDAHGRVGKKPFELSGPSEYGSLAFSSYGETLAVASGGTVRLWDTTTKKLMPLEIPGASVAFSSTGLLAVRENKNVHLWDTTTWKELKARVLEAQFAPQNAVAFSPGGELLAVANGFNGLKLWDTTTWAATELPGCGGYVLSIAFSPDGRTFATGCGDGTVTLWDTETKKAVPSNMQHSAYVFSVAFSPDGKSVATGSADNSLSQWDISWRQDQLPLTRYKWADLGPVAFSQDGSLLANSASDNSVDLWDTRTRQRVATIKGHTKRVRSVAFSPDGHLLATGGEDAQVKLWDIQDISNLTNPVFTNPLFTIARPVEVVSFSPDGKVLAVVHKDAPMQLWNVVLKTELPQLKGACPSVSAVAFSPQHQNGQMVATTCGAGVRLWDLKTGQEFTTLREVWSYGTLAFSPDGETLALSKLDKTIALWNIHGSGEPVVLKGHSEAIRSMAFSPDGKRLVSGGDDGAVKIWDIHSGQELASFKKDWAGDLSIVTSLAFSPDGKKLAIGSMAGALRLWYTADDKDIAAK